MQSPQAGRDLNEEDGATDARADVAADGVSTATNAPNDGAAPARKRPKPGERRVQILQTLAAMLEEPGSDRITTAALAVGRLQRFTRSGFKRSPTEQIEMALGLLT